jgi:hypothetical protein
VSLKDKWSRAFTKVESGYGLVVQDLQKLHTLSQSQAKGIGSLVALEGETPPSLWQGLSIVHDSVALVT